ncbi:DUF6959 family protein [Cellulomonas gilvus]|uniref:Uncharacterized protein n=1 Tax=Cellulomonas gilvus (strain ATCC 13127 / NRRL B-14078) TaxID=593907 RepID=F8A7G7_CELGA|nr:hypothetical protein [Cellulomonas gilvus]AEI12369.1 hypothetical protein Celgi_1863 [Cellulomonas gilvus ATCC 13127]
MTELTLLGEEPGAALILRSSRRQPALLVQGDTLYIATRAAEELVQELQLNGSEDARHGAVEVAETLREWLASYERMMNAAHLDLPYAE